MPIAEPLAHRALDMGQRRPDFAIEARGLAVAIAQEMKAFFGCDGEAGWDRQPDPRHLAEIGAFAAHYRLVAGARVIMGNAGAERVDGFHLLLVSPGNVPLLPNMSPGMPRLAATRAARRLANTVLTSGGWP
ncbi:hypothetical protein GGQ90_003327 [Sphingobium scionense]|uniref:Uncharacterized protein n=1 Tax=Sphingobium scionense TaxID=1404341 RepID=A0A7W6PY16_9SPHN|nr:hypothetical protein [Sphingobium scionense]